MKRGGLGRGLDVLLPQSGELLETVVRDISIDEIDPNASQPRRDFDKEALEQLADSIREAGVLSPILVVENGMRYRIVAGERRYRAARLAGLETVPCILKVSDDLEAAELALIENLQREDLSPVDEAVAFRRMIEEYRYTQEALAMGLGKSRSYIANSMRLLSLSGEALELLGAGKITSGHGRAILSVDGEEGRAYLLKEIVAKGLSVRQAEEMAKKINRAAEERSRKAPQENAPPVFFRQMEDKLRGQLGTKVKIRNTEHGGRIEIDYYSDEDLERILQYLIPEEEA